MNYVNPTAPRGGVLRYSTFGSFDSLNPFLPIGVAAWGLRELAYESLMTRALDEPFTLYGLLAEKVEVAADRRSVIWSLHPKAAFSNGSPVRVEDIIFSAQTLLAQGRPNHRFYYRHIKEMKKIGERKIKFVFDNSSNWEMPLIIGLMPILSKKHFEKNKFGSVRTKTPLGSGPYKVDSFKLGSEITYARNKNYWGDELAINRGRFNFGLIQISYYRDESSRFEAFKAGKFDIFEDTSPTNWSKGYDFSRAKNGEIIKKEFALKTPSGMWGIVFNTRRKLFEDIGVRHALQLSFDADWINKNLFFSLWQNSYSFWARSSLSGVKCCLAKKTPRQRKHEATKLFAEAGWEVRNNKLINQKTQKHFSFEIIVKTRLNERIALIWSNQLKKFGIEAQIRFVDDSQLQRLRQNYNFDMVFARWFLSLSPGNEQKFYWGSEAAKTPNSRNYAGIKDSNIDKLIDDLANAKTRKILRDSTQKLDRELIDGRYLVPLFFAKNQWVALKSSIGAPKSQGLYGYRIENFWDKDLEK